MSAQTDQLAKANAQREESQYATFEDLKGKKPKTIDLPLILAEGEDPKLVHLVAISGPAYNVLVTAHPPTDAERYEQQATFNAETFGPALLSKVVIEPRLSDKQWREIRDDDAWSRGEFMTLFSNAVQICNQGLDLGPLERG